MKEKGRDSEGKLRGDAVEWASCWRLGRAGAVSRGVGVVEDVEVAGLRLKAGGHGIATWVYLISSWETPELAWLGIGAEDSDAGP